jgi:hypothetical protein
LKTVTGVRDEIAADLVGAMQLRDVAGDEQPLVLAVGREQDAQEAVGIGRRRDFDGLGLGMLLHEIADYRQANQVGDALVHVLRPAHAQMLRGGGIRPLHRAVLVQHDRGVRQRARRLLELLEVVRELLLALLVPLAQIVDFNRDFFEHARRLGRFVVLAVAQPGEQAVQVPVQPRDVAGQRERHRLDGAVEQGAHRDTDREQEDEAPDVSRVHRHGLYRDVRDIIPPPGAEL